MSQTATTGLGPDLPGMRCIRLIGSGGFADVYQYERERPRGQQVAVKLLKNFGSDESKHRQFEAEADVMAALEHPYIVPVLWTDTAPDGRPYIVMRYYPSQDLAARISKTPMNVDEALKLGIQLAGAVETAHRAGIIHRDIKPSNVLVSAEGWPALSDFGIAGRPNADDGGQDVAVSVAWSPPEVLTGQSDGSVAADVYSLAATIWNLLAGRAPFEVPGASNEGRDMFPRIVHAKPVATGRDDVPASLERVLEQALAKDPSLRPQSALEFARHFQRVEQELRLGHTEIIVHDPPADLESPAQEPRVSTSERTQLRDGVVGRSTEHTDAGKTIQKAATVVEHPQGVAAAAPTEMRPQRVEEVQGEPRPVDAPRRSRRPVLLAGAGVVVVAAALAVGLSLSHGSTPPLAAPVSGRTTAGNDNTNVLPPVAAAAPDPAPITWTDQGGSIVFTWTAVRGVSRYEWAADPGGSPHQSTATQAVVPRSGQAPTCILVHSVTPGAPDTPGTRVCAQ